MEYAFYIVVIAVVFRQRLAASQRLLALFLIISALTLIYQIKFNLVYSGTDTASYWEFFSQPSALRREIFKRYELIFYGGAFLLKKFHLNAIQILTLYKCLFVSLIVLAFYRLSQINNTRVALTFIALVFCSHVFILEAVNGIRFGVAAAVVLNGYLYLISGKKKMALVVFALAPLCHYSAILIMLAFLTSRVVNIASVLGIILCAAILGTTGLSASLTTLPYMARDQGTAVYQMALFCISYFALVYISSKTNQLKQISPLLKITGLTLAVCFLMIPAPLGLQRWIHYAFYQTALIVALLSDRIHQRRLVRVVIGGGSLLYSYFVINHPSIQHNLLPIHRNQASVIGSHPTAHQEAVNPE